MRFDVPDSLFQRLRDRTGRGLDDKRSGSAVRMQSERRIGWWLAQAPWLVVLAQIASFYAYVLRARLAFGAWPSPHRLDRLDLSIHATLLALGGLATALTPALAIVLLSAARTLGVERRILRTSAGTFVAVYTVWLILLTVDPGHFGQWFLD
jgi:hypothetical protein